MMYGENGIITTKRLSEKYRELSRKENIKACEGKGKEKFTVGGSER